jgi:hypothetical protein
VIRLVGFALMGRLFWFIFVLMRCFLIIFLFLLSISFYGQTTISKKDITGKCKIKLRLDSLKVGDTVVFTKGRKVYKNLYLTSDHKLKEHGFYGRCGNRFFLDYFNKPPEYETIGLWNLDLKDGKTLLTFSMGTLAQDGNTLCWKKKLIFLFVSRTKKQFTFRLLDIDEPRIP